MPKAILCPICKNAVLAENPEFPFCSERCRVIDLGKWASGDYKVSTPIMDPEGFEELEREQLKSEMHGEAEGWKN